MSEQVLLLDMDGTIADYEGQMLRDLAELASPDEPPPSIWADNVPPHIQARMQLIKLRPGWWRELPVHKLGFEIYHQARKMEFSIHVLTKGPNNTVSAWSEKVEWCKQRLHDDVELTITADKGLVYGKVLVDDHPDYMLRWLEWRPRGLGILPASSGNADFSHPNVVRYDGSNLDEVIARLEEVQAEE